ncbi:MAG: polysaccharide pyruvyl transferase family protein [Lachnospiraceae bacterium]|nr:polysaccharide pyruvyl transferase family protein [Lachnospiraceae bacterium]
MKIAILSMQKVINYGSVLQAYSLREMVRKVSGIEASFLDIEDSPSVEAIMPVQDGADYQGEYEYSVRGFRRVKKIMMYCVQKWIFFRKIEHFWKDELAIRREDNEQQYDLVIVGSDEVFKCTDHIRLQLYGSIRQAQKAVTYAASCGAAVSEGIPQEVVPIIRKSMKNFKAMSVRDEGTEKYVRYLYDGQILHHLDPVLVGPLAKRQGKPVPLSKYMIIYAYNDRIRSKREIDAIRGFAKEHNLKTVCFGGVLSWCDLFIPADPFRLLDYFSCAEYVVTDTFHGTIFSIICHKKFVSIQRKTNKNKMSTLLADLELSQRMVCDMEQLATILESEINYEKTDAIIEKERERSENYLKHCVALCRGREL